MVTCKVSQVIVSPGDEGVGNTLISVVAGCEEAIAVAGRVASAPVEEQAVKTNSPINRMLDVFFIGISCNPI
jgi:hypothetical protein